MSLLDQLALVIARRAGTNGVILCFHGVDTQASPSYSSMHIPLPQLEAMLAALQCLGELVPLADIVSRYLRGQRTTGLVALTADDAYASWLSAESILTARSIPITFFAVADALPTGRSFWWDRIDDVADRAALERWREFEDDCGLPTSYRHGQPEGEGRVRPIRQWILAEHAGRWPNTLAKALSKLEDDLGVRTSQRSMTTHELSGFLERTNAQLAVHTVSHAALPFLPDHEVIAEVKGGYEMLRDRFPNVSPYLAIPFGLFDGRTTRLSTEAGMIASLTLAGHPLTRVFSAPFGIPRICAVREHSPARLTLKASAISELIRRVRSPAHDEAAQYPVLPSPTT